MEMTSTYQSEAHRRRLLIAGAAGLGDPVLSDTSGITSATARASEPVPTVQTPQADAQPTVGDTMG